MSSYSVRRPTGSRSVSDQIPYAAQSDCVRCPIGLRTQNGRKLHADGPKSLGKPPQTLGRAIKNLALIYRKSHAKSREYQ